MLGVPLAGPATMLGDNLSVVINISVPSSQLKKKHQAICYNQVREAITAGALIFVNIPSELNSADCLTKLLGGDKLNPLIRPILFYLPKSRYNTVPGVTLDGKDKAENG